MRSPGDAVPLDTKDGASEGAGGGGAGGLAAECGREEGARALQTRTLGARRGRPRPARGAMGGRSRPERGAVEGTGGQTAA